MEEPVKAVEGVLKSSLRQRSPLSHRVVVFFGEEFLIPTLRSTVRVLWAELVILEGYMARC